MTHIPNETLVYFDVDDTLVMHEGVFDTTIKDPYDNCFIQVRKNKKHVQLLKDYKGRGFGVVVWSAGGAEWAKAVVQALELQDYVDLTICKPMKYIDDLPATEILGTRVYLKEKSDDV